MDVRLSEDLERLVQEQVASGRYGSADEVIGEAPHALEGTFIKRVSHAY